MSSISGAMVEAWRLVASLDPRLGDIVGLSLRVSLTAVAIASATSACRSGALIAVSRFPARRTTIVLLNALMGLPPVVVGLLVYLLLSRAGTAGRAWAAVHADGDGDRAGDPDHADHRRAHAPGRRGRVARIPRAASLARARRGSARCRRCSGTCASRW